MASGQEKLDGLRIPCVPFRYDIKVNYIGALYMFFSRGSVAERLIEAEQSTE